MTYLEFALKLSRISNNFYVLIPEMPVSTELRNEHTSTIPYILCGLRINFEQILITKCDFFFSFLSAFDTVSYSYWWKFLYSYWLEKENSFSAMSVIHDLFSTLLYTYQYGMRKNNSIWIYRIYRSHTITSFYGMKTSKPTTVYVTEETWSTSAYIKTETNLDIK